MSFATIFQVHLHLDFPLSEALFFDDFPPNYSFDMILLIYYNILQDDFPNSIQAVEANFLKGISKVDQRQWESGISNFKQYLRSSPKPKFFAVTHYKMAQSFYHLKRYITAREFFDIAREADKEYVKNDPTLLFHMGETYYENADYVTAREIFRMLLKKFPKADFSKLVALRLGDFFRDEGKEEEAIQAYKNADHYIL